jgi:hypothetical protein
MLFSRGLPCCLLVVLLPLGGCGPSLPEGARPTKPVSVTVTYNGNPVEGAIVAFISEESDPVGAYGQTDAQGVAKMKTYVEGDGAVLGKHKVTITKTETEGGTATGQSAESIDPAQSAENYDPAELSPGYVPPTVRYLIPQKYTSADTSGLTAEVTSGSKEFQFDLKD